MDVQVQLSDIASFVMPLKEHKQDNVVGDPQPYLLRISYLSNFYSKKAGVKWFKKEKASS